MNSNFTMKFVFRELSAAELMALKLKQEGGMVCRQISFEGVDASATYVPVDSEPQGFRENYDKFSDMVS